MLHSASLRVPLYSCLLYRILLLCRYRSIGNTSIFLFSKFLLWHAASMRESPKNSTEGAFYYRNRDSDSYRDLLRFGLETKRAVMDGMLFLLLTPWSELKRRFGWFCLIQIRAKQMGLILIAIPPRIAISVMKCALGWLVYRINLTLSNAAYKTNDET